MLQFYHAIFTRLGKFLDRFDFVSANIENVKILSPVFSFFRLVKGQKLNVIRLWVVRMLQFHSGLISDVQMSAEPVIGPKRPAQSVEASGAKLSLFDVLFEEFLFPQQLRQLILVCVALMCDHRWPLMRHYNVHLSLLGQFVEEFEAFDVELAIMEN